MRRTFTLSKRHDEILVFLSKKLDINMTETIQRSIEALQEKEAKREKEVKL
jgi:hypothetical protein